MTRADHITVFKGAAGGTAFAADELVLQEWSDAHWSFGTAEPGLARDLLFALARVLLARLRNTTMRVRR